MCKNCYHKTGRTKPAECCPNKNMYAKNLCQNCYMKNYGKEKRKENKFAKVAAKMAAKTLKDESVDNSSAKTSKKNNVQDKLSVSNKTTATKRPRAPKSLNRRDSMMSEPTAPTHKRAEAQLTPNRI